MTMTTNFSRMVSACLALIASFSSASAIAAVLIQNADVYPVSGPMLAKTSVLIDAGKIQAIGADADAKAADARKIDATGLRLYPGLISTHSSLGLVEIEAVRASVDTAEVGSVNSNAKAQIALHADSDLIPVARAGGVLTVLSVPSVGDGGLFAGQSALVNLRGWTFEEMTLKAPVAMHLYWPSSRLPPWLPKAMIEQANKATVESLRNLEATWMQVQAYRAKSKNGVDSANKDLRLQALLPVLDGTLPLFIHANELSQIRAALAFCAKHKLRFTLVGGLDAWRLSEELRAANVSVILASPFNAPLRRSEGYDVFYSAASKLAAAGVPFAIASDASAMDASLEKNLAHLAAQTVAFGLAPEAALKAITLDAAKILGVADRLGSIEVGKDANLILVRGDVLEITSPVEHVFIAGEEMPMSTRHTQLCQRYEKRYGTNTDSCNNDK
jgi:imidazolonepropionase-like amidohydrolase